ncbi:MAG TPA: response regulator [Thermoleophilaceae bacterium]|nr:response regulator [Thermoleophilaceae bacterium]
MGETVLVVDDHGGFRATVRELLEAEGFDVVGEARDASTGIEAARALRPDIVLLDLQLPDLDGILASKRIAALNGGSAIVLTSSCDPSDVVGVLEDSPALGFVPKPELSGERLRALLTPAGT